MISGRGLQQLRQAISTDSGIDLAVFFPPLETDHPADDRLNLLVDSHQGNETRIRQLASKLVKTAGPQLRIYPLSSARPAAILMRQVLDDGEVWKDHRNQWTQLLDERALIISEAEDHELWTSTVRSAVVGVVEDDDNVTLTLEINPIGARPRKDRSSGLTLVIDCEDDDKEVIRAIYARLQNTGYDFTVLRFSEIATFPFALSHVVRTGTPLKDPQGRWSELQGRRATIIKAGLEQQETVRLARRLFGGPAGVASMN